MSNLPPPPPPLPPSAPGFAAPPMPPPATATNRGGCLKAGAIGCGILLVLMLIALGGLFFYLKNPKNLQGLLDKGIGILETQVKASLAKDVTAEQREELDSAFAEFRGALKNGTMDPDDAQRVNIELQASVRDNSISSEEADALAAALRKAAGSRVDAEDDSGAENGGDAADDASEGSESAEESEPVEGAEPSPDSN